MFHTSVAGGDIASSSFVWTSTTSSAVSWRDMSSGLRAATCFRCSHSCRPEYLMAADVGKQPCGGRRASGANAPIRHNEGREGEISSAVGRAPAQ